MMAALLHDGFGRSVYPTGHPAHDSILRHLGGLRPPGESKPVPPWPDWTAGQAAGGHAAAN